MIPVDLARECFYLPTGSNVPHWNARPASHFTRDKDAVMFNSRWAGKPAGTTSRDDGRRKIVFSHQGVRRSVYGYHVVWMLVHGTVPAQRLDHRNTDCTDDAIGNLREATQSQNIANTGLFAHNTSGAKGVSWRADKMCFRAYIRVAGEYRHLGHFQTREAASEAYQAAAAEAFGSFARAA